MRFSTSSSSILAIAAPALLLSSVVCAIPHENNENENAKAAPLEKRQGLAEIVQLASEAGISIPTDPAVLLSLAPELAALASALPTSSVLSVLETAVPTGFLSSIVHDPAFAASFEGAFAAGSSPSWFNALPTEVKSYLHTYSAYEGVASAVLAAGSVESVAATATTANQTGSVQLTTVTEVFAFTTLTATITVPSSTAGTSGTTGTANSTTTSNSATTTNSAESGASSVSSVASSGLSSVTSVAGSGLSSVLSDISSVVSTASSAVSSVSAAAAVAAMPTGAGHLAMGIAGAVGILGFAAAL